MSDRAFDSSALPYDDSVLRAKKVWFCPNGKCGFQRRLKQGERCPECGDEAKEVDLMSMTELLRLKKGVRGAHP